MSDFFGRMSWLITVRPWITITVLIVLTVVIGAGAQLRAPPTEGASVAFLPPGHPVANATFEIDEFFGESGEISVVTVLFRGEVLTPEGLSQMDDLLNDMVSDPSVSELLVPTDAVVAPSTIVRPFAQALGEESITPAVIEAARNVPEIQFALDALTGTDTDGKPVGIANIRLIDTGDDRLKDAERRINELATGNEGLLRVSSLSPAIVEDEYKQATESGMGPLDRDCVVADSVAASALHAHFVRHVAYADRAYLFDSLGCWSRGMARSERAKPDRPSKFAHCDGAGHHHQSDRGLRDPSGIALS